MRRVLKPLLATAAERLMAVVVLPTPPFWLATVMIILDFLDCINERFAVDVLPHADLRPRRFAASEPTLRAAHCRRSKNCRRCSTRGSCAVGPHMQAAPRRR